MFDPAAESMSADELATVQQRRLGGLVDRLLAADGVQGKRLRECGVQSGREVSLADLPELPTTSKQDLWDHYPYGMLAVPPTDVVVVHGSSGTGGRPTLVGYSSDDLDLWAQMCARSLGCAGASAASTVHNAYGYGLFTGGLGIHAGSVRMGATVVPNSAGMTDRQIRLLVDLAPDVLTCTPSYAVYLGEAIAAAGIDPASLALRVGLLGAEPWTDAMRAKIESLLPIKALDIYGLSEVIGPGVATECVEAQDGLHVNEDHFYAECVDPVTGRPVPEGTPGELVFSTPTKQALPLLRYRTGDLASLRRAPCPCGRTLVKMSKVLGRRDDMLVVRGVNVYPSEIEAVLLADPRVAPQYLVVLDRREDAGARLVVGLEQLAGDEQVRADLDAALAQRLGLHAEVRLYDPGTLPRTEVGKAVRLRVWTDGEPPLPGLT